jgi:hypothetical protein
MTTVSLDDAKIVVIFSQKAANVLKSECDGSEQKDVLRHLKDICEQEYPPDERRHEQIGGVDIYDPTGAVRLYAKAVTHIPSGNAEYHILHIGFIDRGHEYDPNDFHPARGDLKEVAQRLEDMSRIEDVEDFLDQRDAMDADDLADILNRG